MTKSIEIITKNIHRLTYFLTSVINKVKSRDTSAFSANTDGV